LKGAVKQKMQPESDYGTQWKQPRHCV